MTQTGRAARLISNPALRRRFWSKRLLGKRAKLVVFGQKTSLGFNFFQEQAQGDKTLTFMCVFYAFLDPAHLIFVETN
jgi:hypothetical protein